MYVIYLKQDIKLEKVLVNFTAKKLLIIQTTNFIYGSVLNSGLCVILFRK